MFYECGSKERAFYPPPPPQICELYAVFSNQFSTNEAPEGNQNQSFSKFYDWGGGHFLASKLKEERRKSFHVLRMLKRLLGKYAKWKVFNLIFQNLKY